MKQKYPHLSKAQNQNKEEVEANLKENLRFRDRTHQKTKRQKIHMPMTVPTTIIIMIITLPKVRQEAADYSMVRAVADNFEVSIREVEARDLSITNSNFRITDSRKVPIKVTVTNIVIPINRTSRVIKQTNTEVEAMAMTHTKQGDVAMVGSNYHTNNNYQYQYYGHDQQTEQYGPPCSLCRGFNHSIKHCYKGEHNINNIMEKMTINPHQQQQNNFINNGEHDNPHEPPQNELGGCNNIQNTLYLHLTHPSQNPDLFDKLHYIYQHFQDSEKMYYLDPEADIPVPDDNMLYPYTNNDIEYSLFEQKDDSMDHHPMPCTHSYDHITQQIHDLSDSTQQHSLHSMEENASLFTNNSKFQKSWTLRLCHMQCISPATQILLQRSIMSPIRQ